jgi:hypothetical protein
MDDDLDLTLVDLTHLRGLVAEIDSLGIDLEVKPRLFEVLGERFGERVRVSELVDDADYERALSPGGKLGGSFDWRELVDEVREIFSRSGASGPFYAVASVALMAELIQRMELDLASTGIALALYLALKPKTAALPPHSDIVSPLGLDELHELHRAAISAGFADSRAALFAGVAPAFVATIPDVKTPSAQILVDLDAMNTACELADGSSPIAAWLRNAIQLSGRRREGAVFATILRRHETTSALRR